MVDRGLLKPLKAKLQIRWNHYSSIKFCICRHPHNKHPDKNIKQDQILRSHPIPVPPYITTSWLIFLGISFDCFFNFIYVITYSLFHLASFTQLMSVKIIQIVVHSRILFILGLHNTLLHKNVIIYLSIQGFWLVCVVVSHSTFNLHFLNE